MQEEPRASNSQPRTVVLSDFILELRGPANLSAVAVAAQCDVLESELRRLAATLRTRGLHVTTSFT
ncbi:MAG TPA: hypothetical protein VG899_13785 [Mycobacteriales bacterium]|nr:hypothetical protein [Mycobacteriales bacterium]